MTCAVALAVMCRIKQFTLRVRSDKVLTLSRARFSDTRGTVRLDMILRLRLESTDYIKDIDRHGSVATFRLSLHPP